MQPSRATTRLWLIVNPLVRPLAGYAPWWVLLETTGRRTGKSRRTPLAASRLRGNTLSLVSGYGERSAFVKNIRADPDVRVKRRGRWRAARAEVIEPRPEVTSQVGFYARHVVIRTGSEPRIIKVRLDDPAAARP